MRCVFYLAQFVEDAASECGLREQLIGKYRSLEDAQAARDKIIAVDNNLTADEFVIHQVRIKGTWIY